MINKSLIMFYNELEKVKQAAAIARGLGGFLQVPDGDLLDALDNLLQAIDNHERSFELSAKQVSQTFDNEQYADLYGEDVMNILRQKEQEK